jgi:dolichol-phosphate mannosyltransferase
MKVLTMPVVFNERNKINRVLDRFDADYGCDVRVMDDGSTDGSPDVVLEKGFQLIRHEHQKGVGAAIRTGIMYARKAGYEVIVIMAGNDKDRPSEIPRLLKPIIEHDADLVQGSRYLKGGATGKMPAYRKMATRLHPLLFSLACRKRITDSTNGFRAIRLSLFDDQRICLHQDWLNAYELEPYLLFKAITLGYRVIEIPVTKIYPPRKLGYTKMKPIIGWWSILRPIFLLGLHIKK